MAIPDYPEFLGAVTREEPSYQDSAGSRSLPKAGPLARSFHEFSVAVKRLLKRRLLWARVEGFLDCAEFGRSRYGDLVLNASSRRLSSGKMETIVSRRPAAILNGTDSYERRRTMADKSLKLFEFLAKIRYDSTMEPFPRRGTRPADPSQPRTQVLGFAVSDADRALVERLAVVTGARSLSEAIRGAIRNGLERVAGHA